MKRFLAVACEDPALPLVGLWEPLTPDRFDSDETSAKHFVALSLFRPSRLQREPGFSVTPV